MCALRRAVFLDRDGTLNAAVVRDGKPYPPASVEELTLLPGVVEGCARLKAAGYVLVVATNQPDVGRGSQSREAVEAIHDRLRSWLPIDAIEVCYHPGRGYSCDCRKPKPGMLISAAQHLHLDLSLSWMIGDRWRDIDCGHAAGCRTIFINQNYDEALRATPDRSVQDFTQAVLAILEQP